MKRKFTLLLVMLATIVSSSVFVSCKDTEEDLINNLTLQQIKDKQDLESALQTQINNLNALKNELLQKLDSLDDVKCDTSKCTLMLQMLATKTDTADFNALVDSLKQNYVTQTQKEAQLAQDLANINQAINIINQTLQDTLAYNDSLLIVRISKVEQALIQVSALAKQDSIRIDAIDLRLVTMGDSLKVAYENAANAWAQSQSNKLYIDTLRSTVSKHETIIATLRDSVAGLDTKIETIQSILTQAIADSAAANRAYADSLFEKAKEYADAEIATAKNALLDSIDAKVSDLKTYVDAQDAALQTQITTLNTQVTNLESRMTVVEGAIVDIYNQLEAIQDKIKKQVTGITLQQVFNPAFGTVNLPADINTNILIAYYGEALNDVVFPTNSTANNVKHSAALTAGDMAMLTLSGLSQYSAFTGDQLLSDEEDNAGTVYMTINPNTADCTGLNVQLENSQEKSAGVILKPLKKSSKTLTFGFGTTRAGNNGFYEAAARIDDPSLCQKVDVNKGALAADVKDIIKNRQNADFKGIAADMYDLLKGVSLDANALKFTDSDGRSVYSKYAIAATAFKPLSLASYEDLNYKTLPFYEEAMGAIDRLAGTLKGKISGLNNLDIFTSLADLQSYGNSIKIKHVTLINVDSLATAHAADLKISLTFDDTRNFKYTYDVNGLVTSLRVWVDLDGDGVRDANEWAELGYYDSMGNPATAPKIDIDDTYNISITKTVDMTEVFKLVCGQVNNGLEQVDQQVTTILDYLKRVNSVLDDINDLKSSIVNSGNSLVNGAADKIQSILKKGNDIIVNQINLINTRFQPVIIASNVNGSSILSQAKGYPTKIAAGSKFVCTTWNMELLVPVYKKHVAVTNVFRGAANAQDGDAACKAALVAANGTSTMNAVIDGSEKLVDASGLQAGYVYEIAYSALDFHGKISVKKFYVTL